MKVRAWTCGLLAVLMGCNSVDRSNDGGNRPTLLGDRSQVPPGAQPTWQQNNRTSALAYRGPGALGGPSGPYGAGPSGSGTPADPFAAGAPGFGQPNPAMANGFPQAPLQGVQTAGFNAGPSPVPNSGVTQASFNDNPIRVVPPGGLPAGGSGVTDRALSELTRPLPTPGMDQGKSDLGSKRRVMQPMSPSEAMAGPSPLSGAPQALLMAKQEKEPESVTPVKHEDKVGCDAVPSPSIPGSAAPTPTAATTGTPGTPAVRMVNSKRIVLNYEVKDVGPSGVSAVELWVTRDSGHSWHKDEAAGRSGPPYVTEVPEEGMYGFTLVAKSGLGLGKQPPVSGDTPQVWVEVDLTRPVVSLGEVKHGIGAKAREVIINWSAADRNMARRPVTLSYAEKTEGPWLPLAANIENSGRYVWNMPSNGPNTFLVRVEAVDLVGNMGMAQSSTPVVIDMSRPTVSIIGVEPGEK